MLALLLLVSIVKTSTDVLHYPDEVQESAQEFLADDYLFLTVGLVGGACSDVKQVIC